MEFDDIIKSAWKLDKGDIGALRVVIQKIREKIGDDPANPKYISSKYGIGYRFNKN